MRPSTTHCRQIHNIVQSHDEGHRGSQETVAMTFVLELLYDLLGGGPVLQPKGESLGKVLDDGWHGTLLQVPELHCMTVRMVEQQVLEKEDWIEH